MLCHKPYCWIQSNIDESVTCPNHQAMSIDPSQFTILQLLSLLVSTQNSNSTLVLEVFFHLKRKNTLIYLRPLNSSLMSKHRYLCIFLFEIQIIFSCVGPRHICPDVPTLGQSSSMHHTSSS